MNDPLVPSEKMDGSRFAGSGETLSKDEGHRSRFDKLSANGFYKIYITSPSLVELGTEGEEVMGSEFRFTISEARCPKNDARKRLMN